MDLTPQTPNKPHAVCIPYPAQGHINPMLKLAKLLHHRGFHITFVHTEYNLKRLLKSRGPNSLDGLPDFRFESIPDGLPPSDPLQNADATQDIPSLCESTRKNCLDPFRNLLSKLNKSTSVHVPPVTCVVSDGNMSFTVKAAKELGVPIVLFWTMSACGFMAYIQFRKLIEKGLIPLKGMKDIRLRDLPSFARTTNPNDFMLEFALGEVDAAFRGSAVVVNSFDPLENKVLEALSSIFPSFYALGPLHLLVEKTLQNSQLSCIGSNLWKEEFECLEWLNSKQPNSVVFVNFGSITVMTPKQLVEFAWGLANSMKPFLWIIRPDLVIGDSAILPQEFLEETRKRGMMAGWCPQEQVMRHPSIGGFLSHCGWNSILESLSAGLPIICWPFFAEQQTNCRFLCNEWGVGMEIDNDVKQDEVEKLVRELMDGEKGNEMRTKALEWKRKAEEAIEPGGSSFVNLDKVVKEILLQ